MPGNKLTVGLINNKLASCPDTPNCVSSESKAVKNKVKPFTFTGSPKAAWCDLIKSVKETGGKIKENKDNYLWAVYTSKVFRFKDDLECRMDIKNNTIEIRSASRVGYSDFGVNRKRVDTLRLEFQNNQDKTMNSNKDKLNP